MKRTQWLNWDGERMVNREGFYIEKQQESVWYADISGAGKGCIRLYVSMRARSCAGRYFVINENICQGDTPV